MLNRELKIKLIDFDEELIFSFLRVGLLALTEADRCVQHQVKWKGISSILFVLDPTFISTQRTFLHVSLI